MKKFFSLFLFILCFFVLFTCSCKKSGLTEESYTVEIEITDHGVITVLLDAKTAPITVENFLNLARSGFYNGVSFHRIINGFMMQGGDPDGTGYGGSGKTIKGEFSENGVKNNISHTRGAISMARSEEFNSASSQFFIVHQDSTQLDGKYAAFGHVIDGMDIVDNICMSTPSGYNGAVPEEHRPIIKEIRVLDTQTQGEN